MKLIFILNTLSRIHSCNERWSDPLPGRYIRVPLTVLLTFRVCLLRFLAGGRAFAWPRHRWRPQVMTRPDRSVVRYDVINDILAYRREAHQLRTRVGAASLEKTHPIETQKWRWHWIRNWRQARTWIILRQSNKRMQAAQWFPQALEFSACRVTRWFSRQM
jgi:hypothetical protein